MLPSHLPWPHILCPEKWRQVEEVTVVFSATAQDPLHSASSLHWLYSCFYWRWSWTHLPSFGHSAGLPFYFFGFGCHLVATWHGLDAATLFPLLQTTLNEPPALALGWSAQHPAKFSLWWLSCSRCQGIYVHQILYPEEAGEEGWESLSIKCMFVRASCSSSISSFQWREGKCQASIKWFIQSSSVAFLFWKLIVDFHSYNDTISQFDTKHP